MSEQISLVKNTVADDVIFLFERLGTKTLPQWNHFESALLKMIEGLGGSREAFIKHTTIGPTDYMTHQDVTAGAAYLLALYIRRQEQQKNER